MEGGFSNDAYDPGGPTNRGITLDTYAAFKGETIDAETRPRLISELKSIPDDTVRAIYRQRYFKPSMCTAFTAPLALMHFDAAVNHGVSAAIQMLQSVARVTVDGEIGPETLSAIGSRSVVDLIDDYAEVRRSRYRALPHFWRFGRGWLKRVDATLVLGRAWAGAEATNRGLLEPAQIAKGELKMDNGTTDATATDDTSKWWAHSKTMWGTLITAAATVIPVLGPGLGHYAAGGRHHDFRRPGIDGGSGAHGAIRHGACDLRPAQCGERANSAQGLTRMVDLALGGGRSPYSFLVQHGIVSFAKPLKESGWPDWVERL